LLGMARKRVAAIEDAMSVERHGGAWDEAAPVYGKRAAART
jgi:hypothetical protein